MTRYHARQKTNSIITRAFGSQMVAHVGFSAHWLALAGIGLVSAGGFWWLGRSQKA